MSQFGNALFDQVEQHRDANPYAYPHEKPTVSSTRDKIKAATAKLTQK